MSLPRVPPLEFPPPASAASAASASAAGPLLSSQLWTHRSGLPLPPSPPLHSETFFSRLGRGEMGERGRWWSSLPYSPFFFSPPLAAAAADPTSPLGFRPLSDRPSDRPWWWRRRRSDAGDVTSPRAHDDNSHFSSRPPSLLTGGGRPLPPLRFGVDFF